MATGQHVRYVVDVSDNLYPSLVRDERAATALEKSLGGINSQIRNIAGAAGIGFGLHALFAGSKEWIKDVSELEVGLLRVKNASADLATGIKNQLFIQDEVKNFKVGLQETVDAYGSFLFKIKNANLSNDAQNRLYENLLMVSKTAAIPQSEMDATVRNVGIMLGEGVLEARHLRGLSYVHPQIVPFLADALGLKSGEADAFTKILKDRDESDSASQKLSQLISSGKLTKAALPADIIIEAFEAYRKSVEGSLPETLLTIESSTNDLNNAWLDLKNTIVMELKPEIIDLFKNIQGGIQWLKEHKDGIIFLGHALVEVTKYWIAYKAAVLGINAANVVFAAFMEGYTGSAIRQTAVVEGQAVAYNSLAVAIERVNIANQQAMVYGAAGLGQYGIPLAAAGGTSAAGAAAASGATAAAVVSILGSAAVIAAIIGLGATLLDNATRVQVKGYSGGIYSGQIDNEDTYRQGRTPAENIVATPNLTKLGLEPYDPNWVPPWEKAKKEADKKAASKMGAGGKIVPADDRAIGQRVITYNITINGGVNGQKITTQNVNNGDDIDMKVITEKVAQTLEAVMNDTQLHSD